MNGPADDLSERNKHAWADLYGSTSDLVWGRKPVGFLEPFLEPELKAGRKFARALDAATGEGRNLQVLARLTAELTGCDASAEALAKIPTPVASHVRRVRCDLNATPFADREFNFILLSDIIETLPQPAPVLKEMFRVLAPGGLLVCNIPGPEDEVAGVNMTELGRHKYLYHDRFFYQFLEEAEAVRLLQDSGFRILRQKVMHWNEDPHPEFRGDVHQHTSRVFLAAREAGP